MSINNPIIIFIYLLIYCVFLMYCGENMGTVSMTDATYTLVKPILLHPLLKVVRTTDSLHN